MAVYRCNHCGLVAEETAIPDGNKIPCGSCSEKVTLFPAAFYLKKLLERYQAVSRELEALRRQEDESDQEQEQTQAQEAPPALHAILKENLQNTLLLATAEQHQPLQEWFASRQIAVRCDYSQVDTSGFFDEAATLIGEHYHLLGGTLEQLRYGYSKGWSWLNIDLGKNSNKEKQTLKSALRQLYSYTFFARYTFQKQKDAVGVGLQPAKPVQVFLTGGWLEWWAFIRLLEFCLERGLDFSCARSVHIEFQNEQLRELDVVFLLRNVKNEAAYPVIVECKTGEYRTDLLKYSNLQKSLKLDSAQFIICNPDLDDEQANGLSAMYGLSFVNLATFTSHLNSLFDD